MTADKQAQMAVEGRGARRVILESPYAGDVEANVEYARRCVRDSLARGEAPIASHLLYTQPGILRDDVPDERQWGIDAGLAWRTVADATVVYVDRGISRGMQYGIRAAKDAGVPIEMRRLRPAEQFGFQSASEEQNYGTADPIGFGDIEYPADVQPPEEAA